MSNAHNIVRIIPLFSTLALAGCFHNDNGGGAIPGGGAPTSPGFTINTSGGLGGSDGGSGGMGNYVYVYKYGLGNIEVLNLGTADASFTQHTPAAHLGEVPVEITSDTTLPVLALEPAAGTPYLIAGNSDIYISDGDGILGDADQSNADPADDEPIATGLHVAAGATLTVALNYGDRGEFMLQNDFHNEGTVTTADLDATQRGRFAAYQASFINTGTLTTAGSKDGQHGGRIYLWADHSTYNHGTITSRGANGAGAVDPGGNGGSIDLESFYVTQNTATLTSHGGDARTDNDGNPVAEGGGGGYIHLYAEVGDINNSGDFDSRGGDGTRGGHGGYIYTFLDSVGDIYNSGNLDSSGGFGSADNGGNAGYIQFDVWGGGVYNNGDMTSRGGDTTAADFDGGRGGYIDINVYSGSFYESTPGGDIEISGVMDSRGGNAVANGTGSGGDGGYFEVANNDSGYHTDQHIRLLGYTTITADGGDGNQGGDVDDDGIYLYNGNAITFTNVIVSSGDVINEADWSLRGGSVAAGATLSANGGTGGPASLETDASHGMFNPEGAKTVNRGDIDASGGDSKNSDTLTNGEAGAIWLWGYNGVSNNGNLTARGGDDIGTNCTIDCWGNNGDEISLFAELGPTDNSGTIDTSGGNGAYRGGNSNYIGLWGVGVNNSGDLTANGGNADAGLSGSVGGWSTWIELISPDGLNNVTHTGSSSYFGGTGKTKGDDGALIVGGICTGPAC